MATILVVDDSDIVRMQLKTGLIEAGHNVVEAHDGMHALDVVNECGAIDLIIADVNMPRMDGLTMCTEFARISKLNGVPIIMLTTESTQDLKARGKAIGVRAWIIKPLVLSKLVGAIDQLTKKK